MCDSGERSLASQGAPVVCEFSGVELSSVVKNHGMGDAKASDDVLP